MNCTYFIDYPVPALLYDAERGNTHSRLLIFDYFAGLAEYKRDIPPEVSAFIGKQLRMVLNIDEQKALKSRGINDASLKTQTCCEMFNPEGTKKKEYNPLVADLVLLAGSTGDIKAKFEEIAEHPWIHSTPSTVDRQYYAHKDYRSRLSAIQHLLDERQNCTDHIRAHEIVTELKSLTTPS